MRIISGSLKGKKINFIKNSNTRPLRDIVKENIFNILSHSNIIKVKIEYSKILDLYSGVGSFGIECISRGAKKVTFVENNYQSFNLLQNNLANLSILEKSRVINNKIENVLVSDLNEKFNIFFLDPPYADKLFIENLKTIKKNNLFDSNHLVIIHREHKSEDDLTNIINLFFSKNYGRSKVIFGNFY